MLVSRDLLTVLSKDLAPAQLCLIRVIGSDHEYMLRVRYKEIFLDYPLWVSSFHDPQNTNWEEVHGKLVAMARMVVPPDTIDDHNWCPKPEPAILAPQAPGNFHYEW